MYHSGAGNKLHIFWCPIIEKQWFGGGISYVAFDIKFTSRQVGFFPRQLGFLEFCSHNFFTRKNSLVGEVLTKKTGMFSRGHEIITFDGLATCFSIEFLFTNSAPLQKSLNTLQHARSSPIQMVPLIIHKFKFLTEKQHLKLKSKIIIFWWFFWFAAPERYYAPMFVKLLIKVVHNNMRHYCRGIPVNSFTALVQWQ